VAEKFTAEQVRDYWAEQARTHGHSPAASWSDHRAIELEIKEVLSHLRDGESVLDVGCANGYSTVQFAAQRRIEILGLDYVPEMIEQARSRLLRLPAAIRQRVRFEVGDITRLTQPAAAYDAVVVIRVLINLGGESGQERALRECARMLKPGGRLLLSEATVQGWKRMNALRREWGLPDVTMPAFNQYVDQDRIVAMARPDLKLEEISNFASTYYVGTRVLKPLLIKALGIELDAANPDMEWNRWCAQLPAWGDYGTQKLFVFRRP